MPEDPELRRLRRAERLKLLQIREMKLARIAHRRRLFDLAHFHDICADGYAAEYNELLYLRR
jgi:hypothetical protein